MSYPVIVDLFATVIDSLSAEMDQRIYFHHGHMIEIANVVKQLSKDTDIGNRYPLIALKHDIKQQKRTGNGIEFTANLFIVTLSDPRYYAEDRKELIFKPILTPIYDEFIRQIARSGLFLEQSTNEVNENTQYTEHYFWGREQVMGNEANIFGDWVDCIEIESMKLTALTEC